MLNKVQHLFSHHMIQPFGCDYSTSGVTLEAMQTKICDFLECRTADGPRHDTYLIFYSGPTYKGTGAWALAGSNHMLVSLSFMLCYHRTQNCYTVTIMLGCTSLLILFFKLCVVCLCFLTKVCELISRCLILTSYSVVACHGGGGNIGNTRNSPIIAHCLIQQLMFNSSYWGFCMTAVGLTRLSLVV